ncbi:hypothetical protein L1887_23094 [Cichorium endivia]|nr:hypothetical protein L1887_23094 [Cichorium endivia]
MKQALTTEINTMKEAIVFVHDEMLEHHSCNCWWKWDVVVMVTVKVTRFVGGKVMWRGLGGWFRSGAFVVLGFIIMWSVTLCFIDI